MLNSDTFIRENSFTKMVNLMGKQHHIGAMTCRVLYPDGKPQSAYCRFPSLSGVIYEFISMFKYFSHSKVFYKYDVSQWSYSKSEELKDDLWPGGGCLMIKSEVIRKVGMMDENFKYAYLEDADLCYRIKKAGYSFYYLAEASYYHYHSYTALNCSEEFKDVLSLNLQRNRHYFFAKHYGRINLIILKMIDIKKNILIEIYWLSSYFLKLKDREIIKKKIKLYLKLIAGCFVENKIKL